MPRWLNVEVEKYQGVQMSMWLNAKVARCRGGNMSLWDTGFVTVRPVDERREAECRVAGCLGTLFMCSSSVNSQLMRWIVFSCCIGHLQNPFLNARISYQTLCTELGLEPIVVGCRNAVPL